MKLPSWISFKNFQESIKKQHSELVKLFPEMVWKFYTTECVKDSELAEEIETYKTYDKTKIRTDATPRRDWNTLGSYLCWTWNLFDEWVYETYMNLHVQDVPSRALAFTPNWRWLSYHTNSALTKLSLKQEFAKWMYCIPLDVDKKDYDKVWYPLPECLQKYWTRAETDPIDFVYRRFDNTKDLVPDSIEWINEYFYKQIVNNIWRVNITPWGFHAYIMIDPEELDDPFFANMKSEDYNFYMKWFHKIVGSDLMFDASRVNLTDVMRLPWSLHRKFKVTKNDQQHAYICIPCPIKSINYTDKEEDWTVREHVIELWEPFSVTKEWMKYANKWRVKLIFQQIKWWIEDPWFLKKIDWYRNEPQTNKYKKQRWKQELSASEKEIWRCCMYCWLDRWKVIDNLPGNYVAFDKSYWALLYRWKWWQLAKTSWYKFKRMALLSEKEINNIVAWTSRYNSEWVEANYCWWYVNDWFSKHDRPAWPMINFVFMYMQQFVCPKWALVTDIYSEVKDYFKKICPSIDETVLTNGTKLQPWVRLIWKPSCFLECKPDWVTCKYFKQTATWKEVVLENWFSIFDRPVNFVWRLIMKNEWAKFIPNNEDDVVSKYKVWTDWELTRDEDDYIIKYLIEVNWNTYAISASSYANQFERQLVKNKTWLHFLWWDELCKRFFNALDSACVEELETFNEYWLKTIWWNQWSKYWINHETWKVYCVIWDTAICWDCPEILEWVDDTAVDIIDKSLENVSIKEYRKHVKKLWEPLVYEKIFISSWSCQFMNIAEEVMKSNMSITLWPNVNIYWWSETWKSSLRYAIQSSLWYKQDKKYLSMQMTTPQPLIDSMLDWACMLYEEMTSKVESDQKKQEAKEIVIRGAANKETKMTGWLQAKKAVKMRSCNIYFWESSIKDDSANNRIIKIKLTKWIRNPNREEWESELKWLQNHTVYKELYPKIMEAYEDKNKLFKLFVKYKNIIKDKFDNERLWDLECFWAVLYVEILKLWTIDRFLELMEYNIDNDISNIRDIVNTDPRWTVESLIRWLLYRATNEKSQITYWRFDEYPDQNYNWFGKENYSRVVKIDLSTIKTNISNYDNDVEKINEVAPWFVKTVWQSVFIASYWESILNRVTMLYDEWFLEWFDIDMFKDINNLVKEVCMLMCFWKRYQDWYSLESATQSTVCPDLYWNAIKKVIFTSWVML